jgi:hypothetical protein
MQKKLSGEVEGGGNVAARGGLNPTKRSKAEGNTKINVAFPNVFVLFGVS